MRNTDWFQISSECEVDGNKRRGAEGAEEQETGGKAESRPETEAGGVGIVATKADRGRSDVKKHNAGSRNQRKQVSGVNIGTAPTTAGGRPRRALNSARLKRNRGLVVLKEEHS